MGENKKKLKVGKKKNKWKNGEKERKEQIEK